MHFTLEEDYLLGALVVLLIVVIVVAVRRRDHKKKGSFTVIPPPRAGWDNARGGQIHGGTVPGWGEDYTRPPF
jgi:hypothetical protein